jgi:hypothetical protein
VSLATTGGLGLGVRGRRPLDAVPLLPEISDAQPREEGGVRIYREQVGEILRVLRGERVDGVIGAGLQREGNDKRDSERRRKGEKAKKAAKK